MIADQAYDDDDRYVQIFLPLSSVPLPGEWVESAACRGMSPSIFFPEGQNQPRQVDVAQRTCVTCTVRRPCEEYARRHRLYGVWGGWVRLNHRYRHAKFGLQPLYQNDTADTAETA